MLTDEQCEELNHKIDAEGFDYYFSSYGADPLLEEIIGPQIKCYIQARRGLIAALSKNGLEVEI